MKHLELFLQMHSRKWKKNSLTNPVSKRSLEEEPAVLCTCFMLFLFEAGLHGFFPPSRERSYFAAITLLLIVAITVLLLLLLLLSD
jgi:hypothetical protein